MQVLLLSYADRDQSAAPAPRFQTMLAALRQGGIAGQHHALRSRQLLLQILQRESPDIVFSSAYYVDGDSREPCNIHGVLEALDVPYIGSDPDTLELVLSKTDLKDRWKSQRVPTPEYFSVRRVDAQVYGLEHVAKAGAHPYILKPDREGNSRGLSEDSIAFDKLALESKIERLLDSFDEILVERYLGTSPDVREFTVAMIGHGQNKLLMPAEITLKQKRKLRLVTTRDKDNHNTQALPVVDSALNEKLIALADKAFEAAGVRDYSRCDLMMAEGELFAIEINGQPMVPDKWFEACARGIGLDASQYINAIFLAGIVRNIGQGKPNLTIPPEMRRHLPKPILNVLLRTVDG